MREKPRRLQEKFGGVVLFRVADEDGAQGGRLIVRFCMGDIVELDTRQTGVVVDINGRRPDRPIVRLFNAGVNESQFSPELDLSKHTDIGIARIVLETNAARSTGRHRL